jgi:hypothetical protein
VKLQNLLVKGLCIGLCGIFSTLASAKPLSPVHVDITPSQSVTQGQPVEFMVRAAVNMNADNVHILVTIPATLKVVSGELQWQGPLLKGQEKLLRFTAVLAETSAVLEEDPVIHVQAAVLSAAYSGEAQNDAHGQLAANASYIWQTGVSTSTTNLQALSIDSVSKKSRVVERNGITLKEYPLRP